MLRVPLYFPCKSTNLRSASPLDFSQSLNATLDSTRTATRIYLWVVTSLSYPMEKYRSLWSGCFPCVGNGARPTFACKDTRRSEACRVITSPRSFQRLSYGLHINKEQMKSYRNNKCPVLSIKVNRSSSSYHNFFHRILHGCAKPSIDSAGCRKPSKGNMIRRPDHLSASHFVLNPP